MFGKASLANTGGVPTTAAFAVSIPCRWKGRMSIITTFTLITDQSTLSAVLRLKLLYPSVFRFGDCATVYV